MIDKKALIQKSMSNRVKKESKKSLPEKKLPALDYTDFKQFDSYRDVQLYNFAAQQLKLQNPFYKVHSGLAADTTVINGIDYINFSSYNYLGLNGESRILEQAKQALEHYGVSSSASRLVSGERPIQRQLETELAKLHQVDDAILFVSGHATNVTTIGHLFNEKDLIIHDALIHNSSLEGAKLSGAKRLSFAHNDWSELDALLSKQRNNFERVLIVIESLYSMDGDMPDLPEFIRIKEKHSALLMVDEAHSVGVLGGSGRGIAEHYHIDSKQVDIWMGTLSKTLSSCGGYIAGSQALVDMLKAGAPGFVYSVGIPPVLAAASLAALQVMLEEPQRVAKLRENSKLFDELARAEGIDTGVNVQRAIIPVMTTSSVDAVRLSASLFNRGINAQPIIYPAVEERLARLRFFISSTHSEEQIRKTVSVLSQSMQALSNSE